MKKKVNQELLNEELNKYKLLCEYDFYQEKKEAPEYKELILGDIDEETEVDNSDEANDVAKELDIDISGSSEDNTEDEPETVEPPKEPVQGTQSDDVEVDVTSLVRSSEDAKKSADMANHNSKLLMQKLSDLETRISRMDAVSKKIEDLEKELIKRNPTPVEKLEMRSLSSFPYSQKLTDYWKDKEGPYDTMDTKKEYVLTKDDLDDDYSDSKIAKTFSVDNTKENNF